MESEPYRCDARKTVKEFYFGSMTKYVWDSQQQLYVKSNEEKSFFCCYACNIECSAFKAQGLCEFTDIENIASQG